MAKKIEPGMPCIIRHSEHNDGRIVTPIKFLGERDFLLPDGTHAPLRAWLVEETLTKKYPPGVTPPLDSAHVCPEYNLFPLDNPGDDEEDTISKIRNLEHVR